MDKLRIDWRSLWESFDDWYKDKDDPLWEDQKGQLEFLVNEQLFNQQLARQPKLKG